MTEKIYIGTGKEIEGKYGTFMKFSIPIAELEILCQQARTDNGWAKITINRRREPSANGATHYGLLDTWKPNPDRQATAGEESQTDGLPF